METAEDGGSFSRFGEAIFTCEHQTCSSCRACEAAFGGEAVVKPDDAVYLNHRVC